MRRPVGVKCSLFFRWTRFSPAEWPHCRYPSIRTLVERIFFVAHFASQKRISISRTNSAAVAMMSNHDRAGYNDRLYGKPYRIETASSSKDRRAETRKALWAAV